MVIRHAICLVAIASVLYGLTVTDAAAHFVWVDSEQEADGTHAALLFFSEGPHDHNYHLPAPIAAAELHARTADNQRIPLATKERDTEDYTGLVADLPSDQVIALETVCQYGIYAGSLLRYYSQHLLADSSGKLPTVNISADLPLSIVPERKPGGLSAKVQWRGKPLGDVAVTLIDSADGTQEESTDADGKAFFALGRAGTIGLLTSMIEKDQSGDLEGKKYSGIAHYATLTLKFTPSKVSRPPVKKASAKSHKSRPTGAFGPVLPHAVSSFGAAVNDGWLYVYGGHTGREHQHSRENLSDTFCRLQLADPTEWEILPMQTRLQGLALVSCGEALYRVGGLGPHNARNEKEDLHSVDEFSRFDPPTNSWTDFPPLPGARSSHDAAALGSKIYVVGGWDLTGDRTGDWQTSALVYDTADGSAGTWQELPHPPFQRRALALAAWRGQLWVLGGMDDSGAICRNVFCFDPAKNSWSEGPQLPGEDMQGFGLAAWGHNSGLYASGTDGVLYRMPEPNEQWQQAGTLSQPRFFHRLMPCGKDAVLIVAGASLSEGHLDTLERIEVRSE